MNELPLFNQTPLDEAVRALRNDLLAPGGPRISTMRNYRFAILPYKPSEEFKLRRAVRRSHRRRASDGGLPRCLHVRVPGSHLLAQGVVWRAGGGMVLLPRLGAAS